MLLGARGSIPVEALRYKPEGHGFQTQLGNWILLICLLFTAAPIHGVYSASNINENQR
jgi:hypothetical protein